MIGRLIDHSVYVLAAAALLLAVTSAPMRHHSPRPSASSYSSLSLAHNYPVCKDGYRGRSKTAAGCSFRAADPLGADFKDELEADIEIEDELSVATPPVSVCFDARPTPSLKPHAELINSAVALAGRPLRC
ncbi:hypothetical protein [Paludisphaera rhizosphaerae]|uniref:hypothetical protein n=1 Tax=Paludisphaera rhizosphaerae TaxID=2711216 RepID=UPI0013EB0A8F|nr:hypothetical protein [Paludisphaera rhizosphaerae]